MYCPQIYEISIFEPGKLSPQFVISISSTILPSISEPELSNAHKKGR
jgi:hypothetical protein